MKPAPAVFCMCTHSYVCDFRKPIKEVPSVLRQDQDENMVLRLKYNITSSRLITLWRINLVMTRMVKDNTTEGRTTSKALIWATHLNLRVFQCIYIHKHEDKHYTYQHTHIQNNRRLLSARYFPYSVRIASAVNGNPQGTEIITRLGAIIYGSTSCPVSSGQTGFTILSYTLSDLSLCSSDRHSVCPFYHLNAVQRLKKRA